MFIVSELKVRPAFAPVNAKAALSVVLLIGARLLIRSFVELRRIDLGFDPHGALTARVTPHAVVRERCRRHSNDPRPETATRRSPGRPGRGRDAVVAADRDDRQLLDHAGRPPEATGRKPERRLAGGDPGYFEAMGIPLARGRSFADGDDENAPVAARRAPSTRDRNPNGAWRTVYDLWLSGVVPRFERH
jgi:putative ABC transport system permease protein